MSQATAVRHSDTLAIAGTTEFWRPLLHRLILSPYRFLPDSPSVSPCQGPSLAAKHRFHFAVDRGGPHTKLRYREIGKPARALRPEGAAHLDQHPGQVLDKPMVELEGSTTSFISGFELGYLPGDRNHRVPEQQGYPRSRTAHRQQQVTTHDLAL
jgi:hypothetical protein